MTLEIIIGAGVMAFLAAYMLWKIAENNRYKESTGTSDGFGTHNALQIIFFFMIIASLVILGRAGLDSGQDCSFLLTNQTVDGNLTIFNHDYVCEDTMNNNNLWMYKLPLWMAILSALYLVIYLFIMIANIVKNHIFKGDKRG